MVGNERSGRAPRLQELGEGGEGVEVARTEGVGDVTEVLAE